MGIGGKLEKKVVAITAISILGVYLFSISAFAQNSAIPEWVKNNAKWWADGNIGESDYVSSIQYLINQGIIKIPITEVTAATTSIGDNERAKSFVVHFYGGDFFTQKITIYTYSQFIHFSETITTDTISSFQERPGFLLRSLPTHDKEPIYDLINLYVNAGKKPEMFDVSVDVLAGDGTIIQTWAYKKCDVVDYAVFVNDNEEQYRFSDEDEAEIRDVLVIECAGFSLS